MEILYEDNHFIAINKPPSEIVQGDKTGDSPLSEKLKQYIKEKYNKPGDVFLGVPHRIDRPVSGVLLFAKTGKALGRINEMFRNKEVKKTYWAVVGNRPPAEAGQLVHYLRKNQQANVSRAYEKEVPDSKKAELEYLLKATSENYFLLEVYPHTGRHHQIRAQLSAIGCPIRGDVKYGAKRPNADLSIHLHALRMEFMHPVKKTVVRISCPPPAGDALWRAFAAQLDRPE